MVNGGTGVYDGEYDSESQPVTKDSLLLYKLMVRLFKDLIQQKGRNESDQLERSLDPIVSKADQ